jgi:hypothetical protein
MEIIYESNEETKQRGFGFGSTECPIKIEAQVLLI